MDYTAFSHGQVHSKIWLCEHLEPHIPVNSRITILGSWYNITAFMLLTRNPTSYKSITGFDINPDAISIANRVCEAWIVNESIVQNNVGDANDADYTATDVIINTSPEHMIHTNWFDNIPLGKLVCLQSSNVTDQNDPWLVVNPSTSLDAFKQKYPLSSMLFCDTLRIQYSNGWGYDRYMVIGIK